MPAHHAHTGITREARCGWPACCNSSKVEAAAARVGFAGARVSPEPAASLGGHAPHLPSWWRDAGAHWRSVGAPADPGPTPVGLQGAHRAPGPGPSRRLPAPATIASGNFNGGGRGHDRREPGARLGLSLGGGTRCQRGGATCESVHGTDGTATRTPSSPPAQLAATSIQLHRRSRVRSALR
jgi:hypothetical protein